MRAGCLTQDGSQRPHIEFSVQWDGQSLLLSVGGHPAQFDVATSLGMHLEAEVAHDGYHFGAREAP